MIERTLDVETADGVMPTFVTYPEAPGPHPVVLFYMDAPGIREELRDLCRRLAVVGYYVMLPNLFYRDGGPAFDPAELRIRLDPLMMDLNLKTTNTMVLRDTAALLKFAAADPAADPQRTGAVGTCMGGRHGMLAAAEFPDQVLAFASLHGGRMVTDDPDSAHLAIGKLKAEGYFGWAQDDAVAPAEHMEIYKKALRDQGLPHRVELHANAHHGFFFPQRHSYDKDAAERSWERIFALFKRNLG